MSLATFSRMQAEYAVALVMAAFLTFAAVIVPNYQKYAYANTEAVEYDKYEDYAGYPAAEGFPTITSLEELNAMKERNFTIEMDMDKLTPLDFYMEIVDRTYSTNGFMRKINNNDFGGIGRFFIAELKSGELVLVFLDDTTIQLPTEGRITLPIGKYRTLGEGKFRDVLEEKSGFSEVTYYIDMAGDWRSGEAAEKVENVRSWIMVIVFVGSWVLFSYLLIKAGRNKKKENCNTA